MWRHEDICRTAAEALAAAEADLRAEQAVYGLDALDEVALHPILERGFASGDLGVYRERLYPGQIEKRSKASARERCDLVLTPDPNTPLIDPVAELKIQDAAAGTLFAPIADALAPDTPVTETGEAYWLELKAVAQFSYVDGVPMPNRTYASSLVRGLAGDIVKLAREPMIESAGAILTLFAADEPTARHDLAMLAHKLLDRDLPIAMPEIEVVPIDDRAGNAICAVALFPVRL